MFGLCIIRLETVLAILLYFVMDMYERDRVLRCPIDIMITAQKVTNLS